MKESVKVVTDAWEYGRSAANYCKRRYAREESNLRPHSFQAQTTADCATTACEAWVESSDVFALRAKRERAHCKAACKEELALPMKLQLLEGITCFKVDQMQK